MAKLFDSHAHILDPAFQEDFDQVLTRTLEACGAIMNVGCESLEDFEKTVQLAENHPTIFAAVALHPANEPDRTEALMDRLADLARHPQVRAIGETGLDYYWMTSGKEAQMTLLRDHIDLAKAVNKPIIIHDRDAHRDCLDTLWANDAQSVGGVFHAYSGSVEMMEEILAHNFYIGIGGVVTFKNAKTIKEVAKAVPLDRLVIETDCPYLTPAPYRGKRNEPAYTRYVAEAISDLRGEPVDRIIDQTWHNACRLFKLDPEDLSLLDQ
ncbi:TatD family hydrolase [Peptococcus simiae]|uniref:TatD family hydrolase n=1 Tax=Peptococcus simiae TaxID=1643805 RepID=A0ABW9H0Z9_9FIRM